VPFGAGVRITHVLDLPAVLIKDKCACVHIVFWLLSNLYAAGGAARGVSGRGADGYLAGNGLLSAVGGGWLVAQDIAQKLQAA
jgi:fumarate reductase flavoprotein subunit